MSIFIKDTFTDTDNTLLENHTGETGATWTKHTTTGTGSAQITNANRLQSGTANSVIYTASGTPASAVYTVEVIFRMLTDINDVGCVCGRIASTSVANGYISYAYGGIQYYLSRLDSGVETVLAQVDETYNTAQDYRLSLHLTDSQKRMSIDSIEKLTSADNTYTAAGLAGVLFNLAAGSDTTGTHLDNFVASEGMPYRKRIGGIPFVAHQRGVW